MPDVFFRMQETELPWVTARSELGQIETPWEIAVPMAKWVLSGGQSSVFDPAVGRGQLLKAASHVSLAPLQMAGMEIDSATAREAQNSLPFPVTIMQGDYLLHPTRQYSGILANPPYIKAQFLSYTKEQWCGFSEKWKVRLSRKTNLYALFLLKIWHDLLPGARAAVLIPSEFLSSNFGVPIKEALVSQIVPSGIAVFCHNVNVFSVALTTSCVVFLEKGSRPRNLWMVKLSTPKELDSFVDELNRGDHPKGSVSMLAGSPSDKWTNLLIPNAAPQIERHTLANYFSCKRGMATGNNNYFTLTTHEVRSWGLQAHIRPCVCRASDVRAMSFNSADHARNSDQGKKAFILTPQSPPCHALNSYLAEGVRIAADKSYLAAHRPAWYIQDSRTPPDVLVGVFTRHGPKFVLNEAQVHNLTCYHGLYLRPGVSPHMSKLVVLYMNSLVGNGAFRLACRDYGGGLSKLEPRDVESISVPQWPRQISVALQKKIDDIWEIAVREPNPSETISSLLSEADLI